MGTRHLQCHPPALQDGRRWEVSKAHRTFPATHPVPIPCQYGMAHAPCHLLSLHPLAQATSAMPSRLGLLLEKLDPVRVGAPALTQRGKGKRFNLLSSLTSGLGCYFWSCRHCRPGRSGGRRGCSGSATHSSTLGTSPSSHNTWTTGAQSILTWGSALRVLSHLQLYRAPVSPLENITTCPAPSLQLPTSTFHQQTPP